MGVYFLGTFNHSLFSRKARMASVRFSDIQIVQILPNVLCFSKKLFKGSGYRKMIGVGNLYTDTIGYRTVVIDVCLLFNGPVVFSAIYFRFLLVKLN
jgi:hypothetical protein